MMRVRWAYSFPVAACPPAKKYDAVAKPTTRWAFAFLVVSLPQTPPHPSNGDGVAEGTQAERPGEPGALAPGTIASFTGAAAGAEGTSMVTRCPVFFAIFSALILS